MYDTAIIGGGIVGLAAAYQFGRRHPDRSLIVLEKEAEIATHQTGRNSGVIHSGIYYRPGTLRAEHCRDGKRALITFCKEEGIPYDMCGKVIVAVTEEERPRLHAIQERGALNGIPCELIGPEKLRQIEPHVFGVEAIFVPDAGIVDYRTVSHRLADRVRQCGHEVRTNAKVLSMRNERDGVVLETAAGEVRAAWAINCAGLYSDHVAGMSGADRDVRIVPFRGEYFQLRPQARHLCRGLIYPVPDPAFPFLGVHFTRMIGGGVECGPNAVFAFAREGYTGRNVNIREFLDAVGFAGFRRLARRHWRTGAYEMWRSFSKKAFVESLQRLVPDVRLEDLESAPAGVRAQAVTPEGTLVDEFLIRTTGRVVNVCNAASPAATACLNVGNVIVDSLDAELSVSR
jgi:(S)-2-hydroxyglutarate dehydrogenase